MRTALSDADNSLDRPEKSGIDEDLKTCFEMGMLEVRFNAPDIGFATIGVTAACTAWGDVADDESSALQFLSRRIF